MPQALLRWPWASLRVRLLLATLVGLAVALVLAGFLLQDLFQEHVRKQFQISLTRQLDQVTARFTLNPEAAPTVDARALSDPRWQLPYSGLYWQVDKVSPDGQYRSALLRSRSLWDSTLHLSHDTLADGAVHLHEANGPQDSKLLLLERTVQVAEQHGDIRWRLIVAADLQETRLATQNFRQVLGLSLLTLFVLLALATVAQLWIGLRPLREMQRGLKEVQNARLPNLQGQFPSEIQPLVNDFNRVLDQNRTVVERARTQAGNLAHALKTPLSVLDQAASRELNQHESDLADLVQEQVASARRHIDWHLARARVSATQRLPGQRTAVLQTVQGLVRVMERVHAGRDLTIDLQSAAVTAEVTWYFAGEEQDLQEMMGNLLDNACKWARHRVAISIISPSPSTTPLQWCCTITDDGPGIADTHLNAVTHRGVRFDEAVPGTGLGLAIVQELAELYGGRLELGRATSGGLEARLCLPAT